MNIGQWTKIEEIVTPFVFVYPKINLTISIILYQFNYVIFICFILMKSLSFIYWIETIKNFNWGCVSDIERVERNRINWKKIFKNCLVPVWLRLTKRLFQFIDQFVKAQFCHWMFYFWYIYFNIGNITA